MAEKELCRAASKTEAEMMLEILENNHVNAYYLNDSPLQYAEHVAGDSGQEQIIYVNEDDYEKAKELLDFQETEFDDEFENDYQRLLKRKRRNARIGAVFFAVLAVAVIAVGVLWKFQ